MNLLLLTTGVLLVSAATVQEANGSTAGTAPAIARIASQVISLGAPAPTVSFTIGDQQTTAQALMVTASSSNAALVPNSNLTLGGAGNNRTLLVTPAVGQVGSTVITIRVSDGLLQSSTTFNFTVDSSAGSTVTLGWDPSKTTPLAGYKIYYGTGTRSYTKSTAVSNVTSGTVSGLSPGQLYYFAVTAVNAAGVESDYSNEISYRVPEAGARNAAPTLSPIPAITTKQGISSPAVAFTISDGETSSSALVLSASSSNPGLVPAANIVFGGGSGDARSLQFTPASGKSGSALLTVTVSDGSLSSSTMLSVTVESTTTTAPTIALTVPSSVSYIAPATVALAATVVPNGQTISKVQFYNGSTLLGEDTAPAYLYIWAGVPAGTYSLTARALYGSSVVNSLPISLTVGGLPAPWTARDFGGGNVGGYASIAGGSYTVAGAGYVAGTSDNFRFLYQPLTADGEIRARLGSLANALGKGGAYVMIRESLSTGSPYAAMGISPDYISRWQQRTSLKATSTSIAGTQLAPGKAWFRLVRSGNTLVGYVSTDGSTWTELRRVALTMPANIYIGLGSASGVSYNLGVATFTDVTVIP